jgi:chitin disaccharide deacetylase
LASRRLIVTADDAGLHPAIDRGIVAAHRRGIVTACSVVANGESFEHAVEILAKEPRLEIGVHLTFVEEKPLSDSSAVRSLIGADGKFPPDHKRVATRWLLRRMNLQELEGELRKQIERVRDAGVSITHLNSHQHLHLLPGVLELTVRMAEEYGIPYVRVPRDQGGNAGVGRRLAVKVLSTLGSRAARRATGRVRIPERTIGITGAGRLDEAQLIELAAEVEGVTELVVHPALPDPALAARYGWKYRWSDELAALCSPRVRAELERRGIELIAPGALMAQFG